MFSTNLKRAEVVVALSVSVVVLLGLGHQHETLELGGQAGSPVDVLKCGKGLKKMWMVNE